MVTNNSLWKYSAKHKKLHGPGNNLENTKTLLRFEFHGLWDSFQLFDSEFFPLWFFWRGAGITTNLSIHKGFHITSMSCKFPAADVINANLNSYPFKGRRGSDILQHVLSHLPTRSLTLDSTSLLFLNQTSHFQRFLPRVVQNPKNLCNRDLQNIQLTNNELKVI